MTQHALNTTQMSVWVISNAVQNRHETWFRCNFIAETPLVTIKNNVFPLDIA